jgi:hypothetical protein
MSYWFMDLLQDNCSLHPDFSTKITARLVIGLRDHDKMHHYNVQKKITPIDTVPMTKIYNFRFGYTNAHTLICPTIVGFDTLTSLTVSLYLNVSWIKSQRLLLDTIVSSFTPHPWQDGLSGTLPDIPSSRNVWMTPSERRQ